MAVASTAPLISAPVLGRPDPTTGAVTGHVVAADPEGKKLSYAVATNPSDGALQFNKKSGEFTYTPTAAQRVVSQIAPGDQTSQFTVAVSNGTKADVQTTTITVPISPTPIAGVGQVNTGGLPLGIAATDTRAYVVNASDGTMTVIDTIHRTKITAVQTGDLPTDVVVAPNGSRAYVVTGSDSVQVFDGATNTKVSTYTFTDRVVTHMAISPNGKTLYLSSTTIGGDGSLSAAVTNVDAASGEIVGTVKGVGDPELGGNTGRITVSPNGQKIYVVGTVGTDTALYAFSSSSSSAKQITGVGTRPTAVAVSPDNTRLYVSDLATGTITVLDAKTLKVVGSFASHTSPAALAVNKDGSLLMVVNPVGGISVFDTTHGYAPVTTVATNTIPGTAPQIAASPDGMELYVLDAAHNTMKVVALVPPNHFPTAGPATKVAPDTSTGAINGNVHVADTDHDVLQYTATTPAKGSVVVNRDGTFTYTPTAAARHAASAVNAPAADKVDSFTVTVSDGRRGIVTVPVTVNVLSANVNPTGKSSASSPKSATGIVTGTVRGTDKDKDTITYTGSSTTSKGTVVVGADGKFTYTPTALARHAAATPATAAKTDQFTITMNDGHGGVVGVPVTVKISPTDKAPADAAAGDFFTNPNIGRVFGKITATDTDGDTLAYSAPATTKKGAIVVHNDGTFTYTPTAAARQAASADGASTSTKTDKFKVTVDDGHGGTDTVTVAVDIAPIGLPDHAPTSGTASVGQPNSSGVVTGHVTASDPDRDDLTYTGSTTTSKGSATVNADGTFTYTPTAAARHAASATNATAAQKQDTFTVTANDGFGGTLAVPVTVSVLGANNAPVAGNPAYSISNVDGGSGTVTGQVNITDADADELTYSLASNIDPSIGAVNVDANTGAFTFTPTTQTRQNAYATPGDDSVGFTVSASDGRVATSVDVAAPISAVAPPPPAVSDTLNPDQWLEVNQYIQSSNGRYRLYMQGDGNLVLYDEGQNHKALWASGTNGQPGLHAVMQSDGNLVLYSGSVGKWSSHTNGWNGARLVVQSDSNLVIYSGSTAVWDRNSGVLRNPGSGGGGSTSGRAVGVKRSYNAGVAGNCTWGAYQKWYEATGYYPALTGDAGNWANSARQTGWTVVLDAQPRSIVVFTPALAGNSTGHVGWVLSTQTRADGVYVTIVEMNSLWNGGGFNKWDTRTIKDVVGMSYILAP